MDPKATQKIIPKQGIMLQEPNTLTQDAEKLKKHR
jgi:hypothetical protein